MCIHLIISYIYKYVMYIYIYFFLFLNINVKFPGGYMKRGQNVFIYICSVWHWTVCFFLVGPFSFHPIRLGNCDRGTGVEEPIFYESYIQVRYDIVGSMWIQLCNSYILRALNGPFESRKSTTETQDKIDCLVGGQRKDLVIAKELWFLI